MTPDDVWRVLEDVRDPELPFLSVVDLGVCWDVDVDQGAVTVLVTPTYSGCPAMEIIEEAIDMRLAEAGVSRRHVRRVLSPPWTTERLTARGKRLLREHGVAPPSALVSLRVPVPCPRCASKDTEELSRFGSTACKALHRCRACGEPFDHFKPLTAER